MNEPETANYFSARSAAKILGLKSLCYTRKVLGSPDAKVKSNELERYLYAPQHVYRVKDYLCEKRMKRAKEKGFRCCYQCRCKFDPAELKSGICADCQAWKTVLNFACCGDCTKCNPDADRLKKLKCAVRKMEQRIEWWYR